MKFLPFLSLLLLFACGEKSNGESVQHKPAALPVAAVEETTVTEIEVDTVFTIDYITGKFEPAEHPDFTEINPPLSDRKRYLRKDVLAAFTAMRDAAAKDGVTLKVKSATRNFANQKRIWENKWTGETKIEGGKNAAETWKDPKERALTILKWSSMPGTSRHHWGTDIDINAFENDYFAAGRGLKEYNWLTENAAGFGFCQVYTEKNADRPTGYNEEKWHWTYLPVAKQLTQIAEEKMTDDMISGFKGAEVAGEVGMVENFILGINRACL